MELTILTPYLSALVMKTNSVERITDIRGAIAAIQNSFFFFFACIKIPQQKWLLSMSQLTNSVIIEVTESK